MITAEHISKRYDSVKAVDDVSFSVGEGENLILLGTSGCGKTTTLKMINRLIQLTSGRITVNGSDIIQQAPEALRRGIGYVLQHNSLFPHFTVAENIAVVPRLLGWDKKRIAARTEELLVKMRLPASCVSAYPRELSGGQQQRVNIARALAADPPILLMDEPFGALDTVTRTGISRDFSETQEFIQKTIVMVTHDVQEAFLLGNNICLMNSGRIMQFGKPAELLFRPANDFVREFLAPSFLRLALGAVRVSDVWASLRNRGAAGTPAITIPANSSIWSVLELSTGNNNVQVRNDAGQTIVVHKDDLFTAFGAYKYN